MIACLPQSLHLVLVSFLYFSTKEVSSHVGMNARRFFCFHLLSRLNNSEGSEFAIEILEMSTPSVDTFMTHSYPLDLHVSHFLDVQAHHR
jgi:hypothetical protein